MLQVDKCRSTRAFTAGQTGPSSCRSRRVRAVRATAAAARQGSSRASGAPPHSGSSSTTSVSPGRVSASCRSCAPHTAPRHTSTHPRTDSSDTARHFYRRRGMHARTSFCAPLLVEGPSLRQNKTVPPASRCRSAQQRPMSYSPHDQACLQDAVHACGGQVDATHPCRAGRQAGRPAARVRAAQRVGRNVQLAQRRQTPQAAQRMNAVASQPQHLNMGRPGHPIPAGKTNMVWGHSAPGMASRAHLGRSAGSRKCLPAPCGQVLRVCMRQRAWYATKA